MGMVVRSNVMALNAYRQLGLNNSAVSKSLEKLSSGFRINRAGDDASGLAISEKMKAQITALEQASSNSQDGISLIQTAEGNLSEVHDMLNRMVELSMKAANGTMDDTIDRAALQKEVDALKDEINRISQSANYNGINLLDGTMGLNKDAFTIGENPVDAVDVAAGTEIENAIAGWPAATGTTVGTDTVLHKNGSEGKAGQFTLDVSGLKITNSDDADAGTATFTILGQTIAIDVAADTAMTGKDIAAALEAKINAANTNKGLLGTNGMAETTAADGGVWYKATDNGDGTITFKMVDETGADFTPTEATKDANLVDLNFNLASPTAGGTAQASISITGTGGADGSGQNYGVINVQNATKPVAGQLANTQFTLDTTKLVDGATLTIGDDTYTFAVGADSTVDKTGANVIDITDLDLTNDKAEIINRLTQAAVDNKMFTVGQGATAGTITLAEKNDGAGNSSLTADQQAKLTTEDGIKGLVSLKTASTPASGMGTELTIDGSKIKDGNSINIDGTTYTFVSEKSGTAKDGVVEILMGTNGADALANLQTALETDGYTVEAGSDANTIVIRGEVDAKEAPAIIGGGLTLQIGDTSDSFNKMTVAVADMSTKGLGIDNISVSTAADAAKALDAVKKGADSAINRVSSVRADLGAMQNRLEHTINNLDVAAENMTSANSRIRDTDMAKEMMEYTKMNVLAQAAQAMLAQANQQPQSVLQLLQ